MSSDFPDIENGLTKEQEELIYEIWSVKYTDSVAIEKEVKLIELPLIGYIIAHITPLAENEKDGYYTIWKYDDYKFAEDDIITKYTVIFNTCYDPTAQPGLEYGESIPIGGSNNIECTIEKIMDHWIFYRES